MTAADAGATEESGVEELMRRWDDAGVNSYVSENKQRILVSKVIVPEGERGQGTGTEFMSDVCDLADRTGRRVELSPSSDFGGSKSRLVEFYKRFGFVENKGRNRDFEVSESMYREPGSS